MLVMDPAAWSHYGPAKWLAVVAVALSGLALAFARRRVALTRRGPHRLASLLGAEVAVDGDRVYTVGTGPATAATGVSGEVSTAVSWTDNGGGSWHNSMLPVDLNAPAGAVTVNGEAVNVAAGPRGVVAAVSIDATADLSKLVPGVPAKTLWTANTNGVEVLGSQVSSQCGFSVTGNSTVTITQSVAAKLKAGYVQRVAGAGTTNAVRSSAKAGYTMTPPPPDGQVTTVPCVDATGQAARFVPADQAYRVVKTYSWSQLGIGGPLQQALLGEQLVFTSSDGTHFQPASLPAGTPGAAYLTATPDGFAIEVPSVDGPPVVMQSVNGQQWTRAPFPLPVGATGAFGIGYVDGHLVVVGQTQTGSAAYTLMSDGWQTTVLPGTVNVTAVSFGPLGVGVVGAPGGGDPGSWQVLFSRDGLQWSSASLVRLSAGAVDDANVVVGTNQLVVTVTRPPTGQPSAGLADQVQVVGTPANSPATRCGRVSPA